MQRLLKPQILSTETSYNLSTSDQAFINEISNKFPHIIPSISQRFELFRHLPAEARPRIAIQALDSVKRSGVVQRGYTGNAIESILDHTHNMEHILRRVFRQKSTCVALGFGDNPETIKGKAKIAFRVAMVHDIAEALTTDFSLEDMKKISSEDKNRLEHIANDILFEAYPKRRSMIQRYEEKKTEIDKLVKVSDALESAVDAIAIGMTKDHFNEFMGTAEQTVRKYPEVSLAFGSKALHNIRFVYNNWLHDLQAEYPTEQARRKAVIELII